MREKTAPQILKNVLNNWQPKELTIDLLRSEASVSEQKVFKNKHENKQKKNNL